jgi:hypothetical protein
MIQRCPKCGRWIETKKEGLLGRFARGLLNTTDACIEVGESLAGDKLGTVAGVVGMYAGILGGAAEAVFGDNYKFVCPCGNKWGTDYKEDDQTKEYEHEQEVHMIQERSKDLANKSKSHLDRFDRELQIKVAEEEYPLCKASLYDTLAFIRYKSGKENEALDAINKSLEILDYPDAHATKGVIMGEGRSPFDNYKGLQELLHFRENLPYWATEAEMINILDERSSKFSQHFLELPYRQRKFIVISDVDFVFLPDNLKVLPEKYLPTEMRFPQGHPIVGNIYVCHPYKDKLYLPLDTYQMDMFRDEMEELRYVLQCLWAKDVSIIETNKVETQVDTTINAGAEIGGEYKSIGGKAQGSYSIEDSEFLQIINDCMVGQTFSKMSIPPHVPKEVSWYPHRESWQKLALQLSKGNVLSHNITISTKQSSLISNKEKTSVEAEFNALVAKGGLKGNYDTSSMIKEEVSNEWKLQVNFYPYEKVEESIATSASLLQNNSNDTRLRVKARNQ